MSATFKYSNDFPTRFITWYKFLYKLKRIRRFIRVQKSVTMFLGMQYRPSTELIEIDITYQCNLRCLNCNRSSTQAPDSVHMPVNMIEKFVDDSLNQNKVWRRIRILGGEPTLHPKFSQIIQMLLQYKKAFPDCKIEVVSNGFSKRTVRILDELSSDITIENSFKSSTIQPSFGPFNKAPQDQVVNQFVNYSNGCDIMQSCGVGLTPQGYYPCAVAGGIDRVLGISNGRNEIPAENDSMEDLSERLCKLCGRFEDGHYVPPKLRPKLEEAIISPSWKHIYDSWNERKITIKNMDDPKE